MVRLLLSGVIGLSSLALCFFCSFPVYSSAEEKEALLVRAVNQVEMKKAQDSKWWKAQQGNRLGNQDEVRTLRSSRAIVEFPDSSIMRLGPMTSLVVDIRDRSVRLNIGKVLMKIFHGGKSMRVITPAAVAATVSWVERPPMVAALSLEGIHLAQVDAAGGAQFIVGVGEDKATNIVVIEGNLTVSGKSFSYKLGPAQAISVDFSGMTTGPQPVDLNQIRQGNPDLFGNIEMLATQDEMKATKNDDRNGPTILYSKHDLAHLNMRALAKGAIGGMEGRAYNDYQEVCVYCHTPHNPSGAQVPLWNRQMPQTIEYKMYSSDTMDAIVPYAPSDISLACLSCHDGTIAVDAVIRPPKNTPWVGTGVHYKMRIGGPGSQSCGTCHSKTSAITPSAGVGGAHDGSTRYLEQNLTNDHPISILYAADIDRQFRPAAVDGTLRAPDGNKLKLFNGKVECATCHDPHRPDEQNLEGRSPFLRASIKDSQLCFACHNK